MSGLTAIHAATLEVIWIDSDLSELLEASPFPVQASTLNPKP